MIQKKNKCLVYVFNKNLYGIEEVIWLNGVEWSVLNPVVVGSNPSHSCSKRSTSKFCCIDAIQVAKKLQTKPWRLSGLLCHSIARFSMLEVEGSNLGISISIFKISIMKVEILRTRRRMCRLCNNLFAHAHSFFREFDKVAYP